MEQNAGPAESGDLEVDATETQQSALQYEIEATSIHQGSPKAPVNHEETVAWNTKIEELKQQHERERETLVLRRRPFATLHYFSLAMLQSMGQMLLYIISHKFLLLLFLVVFFGWIKLYEVEGPHEQFMKEVSTFLRYASWWVGLGIASSVGLGSGLHTFVLYLGPHIAMFTLKATLCGRVDLKTAVYDTAIFGKGSTWEFKECESFGIPLYAGTPNSERFSVPILDILQEVHGEAVLWGIGTALGELPPYFVSRAARMSGDKLRKVEDLVTGGSVNSPASSVSGFLNRLKLWTLLHFQHFNFWTILIFASVPNPLFDLAGMMCGQLNVQFWKFFIPTLVGKAIVKTHIQTVFVIALCNNQLMEQLESGLSKLFRSTPAVSRVLDSVLLQLQKAKQKYDNGLDTSKTAPQKFSPAFMWNGFVGIMLLCFIGSIVNATAQSYLFEQQKKEIQGLKKSE